MADDDGKDNRSSVPSSSVHQVMFNDDLLIEILLRLPVISLFFFKSVSKRWLSLITSPSFNLRVTRFTNFHPRPCGLFLQEIKYNNVHIEQDFVSLDSRIPTGKKTSSALNFGCFGSDASKVEVLQSCNGLVLCIIRGTNIADDMIYVYNPSINVFTMLPQVHDLRVRLAFDPAKSPHYKVLHIDTRPTAGPYSKSIKPRIYSSETGCWRIGDTFPLEWFCGQFDRGVYWNDAIHWLDYKNRVRHFKLDVEHPNDTTTQLPETLGWYYIKELFESRGCLLLACAAYFRPKRLGIYEMRNGYSGWSVKYVVDYEHSSIAAFFETWKMSTEVFHFKVLFIVVGEREEESFVVMKICGKVVKYNLLSKTLHTLCDIDTRLFDSRTFPFIASFAGV